MKLLGSKFCTDKTIFTVLGASIYPANKVSKRYKAILGFKPGLLVAVGFRGTCIPNITSNRGVVRITKIKINDQVFDRPSTISKALGVKRPMVPYPLREL